MGQQVEDEEKPWQEYGSPNLRHSHMRRIAFLMRNARRVWRPYSFRIVFLSKWASFGEVHHKRRHQLATIGW